MVLGRFILLNNLAAPSDLPTTCFTVTSPSQSEVMGIANSRAVSHSMQANVSELMRGLERLQLGQKNFQRSLPSDPASRGEHMCKANRPHKQSRCHAELCPLTVIKQTKRGFHGRSCSLDRTLLLQRPACTEKGRGFEPQIPSLN